MSLFYGVWPIFGLVLHNERNHFCENSNMEKYRSFFATFICTEMDNQMIANHPRLSVNDKLPY